jgi:hypothetical protein
MIDLPQQHISRVFVLPLAAFEYLKQYQRSLNFRTGQQHNNSQVLVQILSDHMTHLGLTGKPSPAPLAALLTTRQEPIAGVKQR